MPLPAMPQPPPNIRFPLSLLAVALANACLVWWLALPYRLFPADDLTYYQALQGIGDNVLLPLAERHNPIYWLYLQGCYQVWRLVSSHGQDVFVLAGLGANTLALLALVRIARQLAVGRGWAILAGLLYLSSAWTNTYYFFFSYAPLPTALLLVAFSLMLTGSHTTSAPCRGSLVRLGSSGVVLGLAFWSAPSAALLIAILLATPLLLNHRLPLRQRGKLFVAQAGGFAVGFLPLALLCFRAYASHIVGNIITYHYDDALAKFSYVPRPPPFSFLRIMWEYSPLQTGLALALVPMLGAAVWQRYRRPTSSGAEDTLPQRIQPLWTCLVLSVLCLGHAALIDLLPTTKLARTHFHGFPLALIVLGVGLPHLLNKFSSTKLRRPLTLAFGGMLILSIVLSAIKSLETRSVRFRLPEFLGRQKTLRHIYLIREDPHAEYIRQWLDDSRMTTIGIDAIGQVIDDGHEADGKSALIIGPAGPGSGNSILQHGTMIDFNPTLPQAIKDKAVPIPYFSYYPPFLWEEEICEALFFAGKIPPNGSAASSLHVLLW